MLYMFLDNEHSNGYFSKIYSSNCLKFIFILILDSGGLCVGVTGRSPPLKLLQITY